MILIKREKWFGRGSIRLASYENTHRTTLEALGCSLPRFRVIQKIHPTLRTVNREVSIRA